MEILADVVWSFQQKEYENIQEFDREIEDYQKSILEERARWEKDAIVIDAPEVEVCYEAWVAGPENIMSNEELIDDEDAFDEDNSEDGLYQVELCAKLRAANGSSFTALDLMYQLENQLLNKDLGDHVFFEGLTFHEPTEEEDSVPVYYMYCGS